MSMPSTTTPTGPTVLTSISGLPTAAHEVLHRELLHIHSSLHLILFLLLGPLDSVTPSIVGTITCPRLSATLRALETSIEQIRRSTLTTLVYTEELCSTLGLPHSGSHLTSSSTSITSTSSIRRPPLIVFPSPPSPPGTTTMTTTTDPSHPLDSPPSLPPPAPPSTLTRRPRSTFSRSRSPPRRFDFSLFLTHRPTRFCRKRSSCPLLYDFGSIDYFRFRFSPTSLLPLFYVIFGSLATARIAPLVLIAFLPWLRHLHHLVVWHQSTVSHLVLRRCFIVNFYSYMSFWPRCMPCSIYHSVFVLFRSCLGSPTHNFELILKVWTTHFFSLFASTIPRSTTPTSS